MDCDGEEASGLCWLGSAASTLFAWGGLPTAEEDAPSVERGLWYGASWMYWGETEMQEASALWTVVAATWRYFDTLATWLTPNVWPWLKYGVLCWAILSTVGCLVIGLDKLWPLFCWMRCMLRILFKGTLCLVRCCCCKRRANPSEGEESLAPTDVTWTGPGSTRVWPPCTSISMFEAATRTWFRTI